MLSSGYFQAGYTLKIFQKNMNLVSQYRQDKLIINAQAKITMKVRCNISKQVITFSASGDLIVKPN